MRKKIVPIVVTLLLLAILFIVVNHDNPGLGRKVSQVTEYLSDWLDIDWDFIKRWMSA